MKHKVGDKVRIRPDLRTDKEYDGVNVHVNMLSWKGKEVIISKIESANGYSIKEDPFDCLWIDSMFEDANINNDMIKKMAEFLCQTAIYGNSDIDI